MHRCCITLTDYVNVVFTCQVAETCRLAVERIKWLHSDRATSETLSPNPYSSVDPAPPAVEQDVKALKITLLDETMPLFERYRAMFALRNIGSEDAILALGEGMSVAFVPAIFSCKLSSTEYAITLRMSTVHSCVLSFIQICFKWKQLGKKYIFY